MAYRQGRNRGGEIISHLSTGREESIRRERRVRMPAVRRGLRILRGRLALRGVPELVDENGDTNSRVLHHRLPASCRSFHVEIRPREGKGNNSL